jgi:hypothetical protein
MSILSNTLQAFAMVYALESWGMQEAQENDASVVRDWRGVGKEEETSRCGDIYRDGNIQVEWTWAADSPSDAVIILADLPSVRGHGVPEYRNGAAPSGDWPISYLPNQVPGAWVIFSTIDGR